ncbi:MAG: hypothetical protein NTV33_10950 [Coprothermobacterota bacterium]|nr:hypothetical protein [Coprothermobacterota bacterium]
MKIAKWYNTRFWAVYDSKYKLICLCVYKCGALALVKRLSKKPALVVSQSMIHEKSPKIPFVAWKAKC